MKICITSQGKELNSQVDMRFGRAQYFVILEPDTMAFESIENPNVGGYGGVGIQTAQLMAEKEVKVVLTGNIGPNAFRVLESAGITAFTGISGTVNQVIERYKSGEFTKTQSPTVPGHFGINKIETQSQQELDASKNDNKKKISKQEELKKLKEQLLSLTEQIQKINKQINDSESNN
jgi:predicted Fe-Mo cluster-binding NifX family protein